MEHKNKKVRIPQQKRGIETRKRIIQAARQLFSRKGFHGTNSKEIAAEAGVSIGSFYSYFQDKKSLFLEVLKEHNDQIVEKIFRRKDDKPFYGGDGKELIYSLIESGLAAHDLSPEFHREALSMRYSDPEVEKFFSRTEGLVQEQLISLFKSMGDKLRVKDLRAAAAVVIGAFEEVVHTIRIFQSRVNEKRLVNELADMISSYLFK